MSQNESKQGTPKTNGRVTRPAMRHGPSLTASSRNRSFVFKAQHVDDLARKSWNHVSDRRQFRVDEASLQMTNDPDSAFYRYLRAGLQNTGARDARSTCQQEKLKLFEKYGPELAEFVKDNEGHLKSKFDKVFIT